MFYFLVEINGLNVTIDTQCIFKSIKLTVNAFLLYKESFKQYWKTNDKMCEKEN